MRKMYRYLPLERDPWPAEEQENLVRLVKGTNSIGEIMMLVGKSGFEIIAEMRKISKREKPMLDSDYNPKYKDQSLTMQQVAPSRSTRWSPNEDYYVVKEYIDGTSVYAIANQLQRTAKGVWYRLQDLVLNDKALKDRLFETEKFFIKYKPLSALKNQETAPYEEEEETIDIPDNNTVESEEKETCIDRIRKKYPNAYKPWEDKDDEELLQILNVAIFDMTCKLKRSPGSIEARIKKLLER